MRPSSTNGSMWFSIFSSALVFLSAFLLFMVQPMAGKMILPWYGGTPAVWTTCLLFFQFMLLGGYCYAAFLAKVMRPFRQVLIHLLLLATALVFLPITPDSRWKPLDGDYPTTRILCMLTACVGWPYFLLSATSTLIQSWFARVYPGRSPYRLYTLSNIGSLGALLLYPFVIEPIWSTHEQGRMWSVGFGLFAFGFCFLAAQLWNVRGDQHTNVYSRLLQSSNETRSHDPTWQDRMIWILLPALASMMLLGVTNYLCQDVAVIPFLWIAPLSIYLASLIICFDRDEWYRPRWFSLGAILAIFALFAFVLVDFFQRYNGNLASLPTRHDLRLVIGVYLAMFLLICMVCHGETVRRRPSSDRLSEFYLSVAGGGALGSFTVAVLCPVLFSTYVEFNIGIFLCLILAIGVYVKERHGPASASFVRRMRPFMYGLGFSLLVAGCAQFLVSDQSSSLPQIRNFYGVLTVREHCVDEPQHHGLALYHGPTMHGFQFLEKDKQGQPTAYFTEDSGIGLALKAAHSNGPLRVGVVGLGIGTLACYGQPGDTFRFYEINPSVISLAHSPFTYLSLCSAKVEIVAGDARLSLEREATQNFDVLILDAFSSDSVPVHLLTEEAIDLYLRHTKPDGLIAFQVTNRHLDLVSVVARHADDRKLQSVLIRQESTVFFEKSPSAWLLMSRNPTLFETKGIRDSKTSLPIDERFPVWTDNYHNLFQILRRPSR